MDLPSSNIIMRDVEMQILLSPGPSSRAADEGWGRGSGGGGQGNTPTPTLSAVMVNNERGNYPHI